MINVLITGSSGLIGSAVFSNFRTLQIPQIENVSIAPWSQAELGSFLLHTNRKLALDTYKPDVVLHFAWHSTSGHAYELDSDHSEWALESLLFAKECFDRGIWFICAGSAADSLANEDATHIGNSNYARSKRLLREGVLRYSEPQGHVTWLQIEYVFSLIKQRPRLVHSFLNADDLPNFLPKFPERRHDFIDVADVAQALRVILVNRLFGLVVIGSGYLLSTLSFVQAMKFSLGQLTEYPSISFEATANPPSRLAQAGWTPKHTQALLRF